ncbi:MAG: TatD family deoxyribonuclease [Candidatus Pelagibacter sp. TMED118]|nr:MAG: TatD family deoxyribonuclease [Candidatus Pelagibacter sp. TMED118]|tara:strand:- start:894 stop:1652 length:759 start_codon:yes stop_codon:yes gene_type:complete
MIDSHCHLDREPLNNNIPDILKRSKLAGIEKLLTICTTDKEFDNILNLVQFDTMIFGTYGIHPHESQNYSISKDKIIQNVNINRKIIGVGETGLDFYYNNSEKKAQIKSFSDHIEASIELNVPIIVHSRNAEKETFEILSTYKDLKPKILMHCFTGSLRFAHHLLDLDAYFSASGIITFKNSTELQNTFKSIPLENLLIETDSPFLAPNPHRGKKNEPSFIIHTLKKLSEIKNITSNELDKITSKNFNKLFF